MIMTPDGYRASSVEATIEQLRYWVPTIKDVADVYEGRDDESWLLSIEPLARAACPVAIALKESGHFDLAIAGETYPDLKLEKLDHLLHLLERIADGRVVQRRWYSAVTGVHQGVETIVALGPDLVLCNGTAPDGSLERRDRHFLPYRRRA